MMFGQETATDSSSESISPSKSRLKMENSYLYTHM